MLIITTCSLFLRTFQYVNFFIMSSKHYGFLSYPQKTLTAQQYKII